VPWRRQPVTHAVRALAVAVDVKGGYIPGHSDSVAYLIGMMAREAGYDLESVHMLEMAALAHDLGKIMVPDSILLARRALTDAEFEVMKRHPEISCRIVGMYEGLEELMPWVRHHHERWDGGGYPDGLRGEEIPWPARMLAVADAYQVMTADRPYQLARTRQDAMRILLEEADHQFDARAVDLLIARGAEWIPADPELSAPPRALRSSVH
jgi:HD-GYP domain-containing protein (c-di-GMP phosphodiesterase class II)